HARDRARRDASRRARRRDRTMGRSPSHTGRARHSPRGVRPRDEAIAALTRCAAGSRARRIARHAYRGRSDRDGARAPRACVGVAGPRAGPRLARPPPIGGNPAISRGTPAATSAALASYFSLLTKGRTTKQGYATGPSGCKHTLVVGLAVRSLPIRAPLSRWEIANRSEIAPGDLTRRTRVPGGLVGGVVLPHCGEAELQEDFEVVVRVLADDLVVDARERGFVRRHRRVLGEHELLDALQVALFGVDELGAAARAAARMDVRRVHRADFF